jgi:predicted nucleotidyltransferase component of viral defense system
MKPLRTRIQEAAKAHNAPQMVIEKDYALSYVLAGLAAHLRLKKTLIFKGGTALKKLFFGDYRFSEDLDFSTIDAPTLDDLEHCIRESVTETERLLREHGPFKLSVDRYLEKRPHPGRQEAFNIRVQYPWHREALCTIKLEITHDEPVILEPDLRPVIHGYEETLNVEVRCYRLEEVVAEKMRALLQTQKKLEERGWHRPRARDYYDLWRILTDFGDHLPRGNEFVPLLNRKCEHRGVGFKTIDDFFTDMLRHEAQTHWQTALGTFVKNLPDCTFILNQLKQDLLPTYLEAAR